MKLWIIHTDGIGLTKVIAEILQGYLEGYIEVSVGSVGKIEPSLLVEEMIDYLIIGDVVSEALPCLEIQKWLMEYWEIPKKNVKALSGYYISLTKEIIEPFWVEFIDDNVNADIIFPPILRLKLKTSDITLEDGALGRIRAFASSFLEFIIKN